MGLSTAAVWSASDEVIRFGQQRSPDTLPTMALLVGAIVVSWLVLNDFRAML
jgi:hypothetical protein